MFRRLCIFCLPLLAAGCGPRIDTPSLAPRAAERQPVEFPSSASEVDTPADPKLAARIAAILGSADERHRRFMALHAETATIVERAHDAAPGDEAWTSAQQALSALDVARGGVRAAAADLDALRQEPAAAGTGSRAAIDAAATRIDAIESAETEATNALQARLR